MATSFAHFDVANGCEAERRDYELKLQFIHAKLLNLDPFTLSDVPWDDIPIHTATGTPPPNW